MGKAHDRTAQSTNYRRGRSGRPLTRVKARVYATETHCCICGEWVNKDLPYINPMTGKPDLESKSFEHGNIEADPYDGHLAHLRCNLSKGGREGAAITNGTTPPHTDAMRYRFDDY